MKKSVILIILSVLCFINSQIVRGDNVSYNEKGEKILSRKRRYLVFPEGSSFQVGKYTDHKICSNKI